MTNTNYHIAFDRMLARGASFEIDAAYSNPAGLAWGHEGWQLSFNAQKPFQWRNIEANVPQPFATAIGMNNHLFKGEADANPFVPALFAAYKHKKWAVSMMAGIVGSGGRVTYEEGVPMFVVPVRGMMYKNGLNPSQYSMHAFMEGKQYIYGIQANFTYKFNEHWSAAVGLRANIYTGYSRGHVIARSTAAPIDLVNLQIDVDQTLRDGERHLLAGQRTDEVHGRRHENGSSHRQGARVDRGGNSVGRVVEAVDELKDIGNRDDRYKKWAKHS